MTNKPTSQEQFGREAAKYLTSEAHNRPADIEAALALVGPARETLDVGTGAGHVAFALAARSEHVIALDLTPEMLAVVEQEAARRGITNIECKLGDALAMPFPDESFDGVATRTAAHHFPEIDTFAQEAARVLRPGGWFLVIDTTSPEEPDASHELNHVEALRDPSHSMNWPPSEWVRVCEQAGLAVQEWFVQPKRIAYQAWLDRMSVPADVRPEIERIMWTQPGPAHSVLDPQEIDGHRSFALPEITLVAVKPKAP